MDKTWRGSVCLFVYTRWVLVIGRPEIVWRENWISPENNRMRMLMSFSAYAWEAKTNIFSIALSLSITLLYCSAHLFPSYFLFSFCQSVLLFPPTHANFHPFYPSCFLTVILLSVACCVPIHPSLCSSICSLPPAVLPFTTVVFSMLLTHHF